ncbi:MAG: FAD-dependent monooxygenase [Deltaproteobacteria bacterium]|nr:FAD-dependent monooxygenase [Deltaproteobacteria bacterium]
MSHLETDVLIVGAGPTGLVSALCLEARGVPCLVLERREGLQTHPKAHEVSARSLEVLQGLGFAFEALAAEASPHPDASRVLFCGALSEEFGALDLQAGDGARKYREHLAAPAPYLNLSQVELERLLLARVQASPCATLRYRHQWESLTQDASGVDSRVTDLATGEALQVRSRYVLFADGAASRGRAALGATMVGPEALGDFVNAYLQADLSGVVNSRGKLYFIFSPAAPGSVFIAHHVERRWVFHVRVEPPEKTEDFTPEVMTARVKAALGRDDVDVSITSMSTWRMTAQVADRFRGGRGFLVGDAAHRFPPTGGLGMNSGIGDAHNLCWKLAMVLRGEAPESLLDTYEAERRPVIQRNCDESRRNYESLTEVVEAFGVNVEGLRRARERLGSGPLTARPGALQGWGRRQAERYGASVLARFNHDPEVRARVTAAIARQRPHFDRIGLDLGYTYDEGALCPDGSAPESPRDPVSEYTPSTRPGARFPHFWLDGNRRRVSSHALLSYARSTLLVGAEVPEASASDENRQLRGVSVVRLCPPRVPLSLVHAAHTRCGIARDGALLLRPDGHVAWRQREGVTLSEALLQSILEECYGAV